MGLLGRLRRGFESLQRERGYSPVRIDDDRITLGEGSKARSIDWADIAAVEVVTTDEGLWLCDVSLVFWSRPSDRPDPA